jgi:PAS domain S-box-containing protein
MEQEHLHASDLKPGGRLVIVSWAHLLTTARSAMDAAGEDRLVADIIQLQGLCEQMDADAFFPLTSEELTGPLGRRVIQFNPFMEKLSGYHLDEMRGKDWFSVFLPERDRSRIRQLFLRVLSERETRGINPILAQDGTERLIEWSCTILKDSNGKPEGVLWIGQDITEKATLQEKVIEKERLAAMSITSAKLIHEIGNPLNGLSLTAQLLRSRVDAMKDSDGSMKSGLDRLVKETTRLNQLIREFKSFFASERHVFKPASLATVASEILEVEAATYATRDITVEQSLAENLPLIMGDPDKLKQAVLNLCKNAIEAMPEGGTLTVRAFASGDHVILEIADTGVGIPTSVDVLTPFTTTKASGSGLGLMIVRQIVSTHGGTLTYSSEPSKGTVFSLSFPVMQAASSLE